VRLFFNRKHIYIFLTVAHLDHNPENCDFDNLKAMCQKCHNKHDRKDRKNNRRRRLNSNQLKLNFQDLMIVFTQKSV